MRWNFKEINFAKEGRDMYGVGLWVDLKEINSAKEGRDMYGVGLWVDL